MNIPLRNNLVDEKVCGFYEWKSGLEKDDIKDHGQIIKRPNKDLHHLYKIYIDYQTRPDVSERRKYLYGDSIKTKNNRL